MNRTRSMHLLWLLQLSDTALPIGALNHSFGLETLSAEESLDENVLESFLSDYLCEVSALELHFCGSAFRLVVETIDELLIERWLDLNLKLSAFKIARESRNASATLGRRFLQLVNGQVKSSILTAASDAAFKSGAEIHHCTAFGLAAAALGIDESDAMLAYVHQSLANLISACQRLLPLGQIQATRMLWELKPVIADLVKHAQENHFDIDEAVCFAPLIEMASMRHTSLCTRLFIS